MSCHGSHERSNRVGNFKNTQQDGPSFVLFYLERTCSRKHLIFFRTLIVNKSCHLLEMSKSLVKIFYFCFVSDWVFKTSSIVLLVKCYFISLNSFLSYLWRTWSRMCLIIFIRRLFAIITCHLQRMCRNVLLLKYQYYFISVISFVSYLRRTWSRNCMIFFIRDVSVIINIRSWLVPFLIFLNLKIWGPNSFQLILKGMRNFLLPV